MKLFLVFSLLFAFHVYGKDWNCKRFNKFSTAFWDYGVCAYVIKREVNKTYLYILMPVKGTIKSIPLKLHLLDSGASYTDDKGHGHWAWENMDKITLYGSIGGNGMTPHTFLTNGVLSTVGKWEE